MNRLYATSARSIGENEQLTLAKDREDLGSGHLEEWLKQDGPIGILGHGLVDMVWFW